MTQTTHFADEATLAYISRLERDRAELIEALRNARNHLADNLWVSIESVEARQAMTKNIDALLSRMESK